MEDKPPVVTAVMITGKAAGRRRLALQAVRSFLEQTYPHRELLIVNDSLGDEHQRYSVFNMLDGALTRERCENGFVLRGLLSHRDQRYPCTELWLHRQDSLGQLRNLALKTAKPDSLILQWDDDDWYHPERMTTQVEAYQRTGRPVVLSHQVRYSFPSRTTFVYRNQKDGIAGSLLHPNGPGLEYPALAKHEDSRFLLEHFSRRHVLDNSARPELYLRFYHGENTWDEAHVMKQFSHPKFRGRQIRDALDPGVGQLHAASRDYLFEILTKIYSQTEGVS